MTAEYTESIESPEETAHAHDVKTVVHQFMQSNPGFRLLEESGCDLRLYGTVDRAASWQIIWMYAYRGSTVVAVSAGKLRWAAAAWEIILTDPCVHGSPYDTLVGATETD
jgi:hypothetical protein